MDQRTVECLRLWGREFTPKAVVASGSIYSRDYQCMPILGWLIRDKKLNWPAVVVAFMILNVKMSLSVGRLILNMPLAPLSERAVCSFLQDIGWTGEAWPDDSQEASWPLSESEDENTLKELLSISKLGASLTFPPSEHGFRAARLPLRRRKRGDRKPFLLSPYDESSPAPRYINKLRDLASRLEIFQPLKSKKV